MILVIGEILFDIFPGYKRIGGAPFNFAYHLKKLGLPVRFVSGISNDTEGKEILEFLDKNNFDTDDIQIDPIHETGKVNIRINTDGSHVFDIARNTAFDNIEINSNLIDLIRTEPAMIYYGTLIQRTANGAFLIDKITKKTGRCSVLFCDINLRRDCYSRKSLESSLVAADILKLNIEELNEIAALLYNFSNEIIKPEFLLEQYGIKAILLTSGEQGSRWISTEKQIFREIEKNKSFTDSVGAGDAFAAVSAAGYLKKLPPEKILSLSSEFASYICTIKGALPETDDIYKKLIKKLES